MSQPSTSSVMSRIESILTQQREVCAPLAIHFSCFSSIFFLGDLNRVHSYPPYPDFFLQRGRVAVVEICDDFIFANDSVVRIDALKRISRTLGCGIASQQTSSVVSRFLVRPRTTRLTKRPQFPERRSWCVPFRGERGSNFQMSIFKPHFRLSLELKEGRRPRCDIIRPQHQFLNKYLSRKRRFRNKMRFLLVLCLLLMCVCWCRGTSCSVLHLSDFHMDPFYGTSSGLSCTQRSDSPFGQYGCDSPYTLVFERRATRIAIPPSDRKRMPCGSIHRGDWVRHQVGAMPNVDSSMISIWTNLTGLIHDVLGTTHHLAGAIIHPNGRYRK